MRSEALDFLVPYACLHVGGIASYCWQPPYFVEIECCHECWIPKGRTTGGSWDDSV